jgi:hypothetical protein
MMFLGKLTSFAICAALLLLMRCEGEWRNQTKSNNARTNSADSTMDKSSRQQSSNEDANETWGGNHVRMVIKPGGADLEFDCATGELTQELKPDTDGTFDVQGTFAREGGGPTRQDPSQGRRVRYIGQIKQNSMTFQIHFDGSDETSETFTLTRGSEGRLRKCK